MKSTFCLPVLFYISSPENADQVACDGDFVIVPAHLTMDAAENRKTMAAAAQAANKDKISGRRHTVSGANPVISGASDRNVVRPSNLPMQIGPTSEPIPVPTQKAAYQQIQQRYVLFIKFSIFFIKCERNSSSTFLVLFGPGADPEILFRPCQELVQLPGVLLWDLFPKTELPPRVVQPSPENPHHRTKVPRKFENKHE